LREWTVASASRGLRLKVSPSRSSLERQFAWSAPKMIQAGVSGSIPSFITSFFASGYCFGTLGRDNGLAFLNLGGDVQVQGEELGDQIFPRAEAVGGEDGQPRNLEA
jgi:hypothetical protein